jgi:hypothetical protein
VRPWIDHLGFSIDKAVGAKKPTAFLFTALQTNKTKLSTIKKEPSNVITALYIKYPLYHHACPALPMDNVRAPSGAVSVKFLTHKTRIWFSPEGIYFVGSSLNY